MISFWRIFSLELTGLRRSKTLAMLVAAVVAWTLLLPHFVRGDGTAGGMRELCVHYALGGAFALTLIALTAAATGSFARERSSRRLQLTLVRPVRYFTVALAKILAHVTAGALVIAVAAVTLFFGVGDGSACNHVLSPAMISAHDEALAMYDDYIRDTNTPEVVRRASKDAVVRLLETRALDHYQSIGTNRIASWNFDSIPADCDRLPVSVRIRFSNQYSMRQDLCGEFRLGARTAVVSNQTQAVITVPLADTLPRSGGALAADPHADTLPRSGGALAADPHADTLPCSGGAPAADPHADTLPRSGGALAADHTTTSRLSFANCGRSALMLRPRRDVNLLIPADSFAANLVRTSIALVAVLAFVVAIAVFLSSALGRPVAMFTAFVMLLVGEISPGIVDTYSGELDAPFSDRLGLAITRTVSSLTHPLTALAPAESLAKDECVEPSSVAGLVAVNLIAMPILMSLLAALVIPKKPEDDL